MTTSTPPAWKWLDECSVPVQVYQHLTSETPSDAEPSIHSRNLPESDAKRERNDSSDPTGEDMWPLERDVSCSPDISCDRKDDAPGCDEAAKVTDSVSNSEAGAPDECPAPIYRGCHPSWVCNDCGQDRYGKPNGMSTWHYDYCRFCGEFVPCTEPRDFGDRHDSGQFPGQKTGVEEETHQREQGKDADSFVVTSCPECEAVTDVEYPDLMAEGYREMAEDSLATAEANLPADCRGCKPEPARFAHETHTNLSVGARSGHTLDDNPLLDHMECTFNSCMDIAVAKNEGYAGTADPMANFKDSVRLGVPVPIGVAIRLSDKWARLCRLLQTGENPLADESITDTILDSINYLAILLYALEDQ